MLGREPDFAAQRLKTSWMRVLSDSNMGNLRRDQSPDVRPTEVGLRTG